MIAMEKSTNSSVTRHQPWCTYSVVLCIFPAGLRRLSHNNSTKAGTVSGELPVRPKGSSCRCSCMTAAGVAYGQGLLSGRSYSPNWAGYATLGSPSDSLMLAVALLETENLMVAGL